MTATTLDTRSWEIRNADLLFRIVALTIVAMALAFLFNNYLIFWRDWPGIVNLFSHQGWFGFEPLQLPFPATRSRWGGFNWPAIGGCLYLSLVML